MIPSRIFQIVVRSGIAIGTALVVFMVASLILAVAPGSVMNPFFGPHEDDVQIVFDTSNCSWGPLISHSAPRDFYCQADEVIAGFGTDDDDGGGLCTNCQTHVQAYCCKLIAQ